MIFNLEAGEVKTLPIVSTKYPEDITVKAGENAVFSAVIEKDGIPTEYTYQWYVNNSLVSGATTAVYTRKTDSDKGVYSVYCEITNKAGFVKTRTATLTVNALPKLDSTKLEDVSCYIGDSKTFEVSISEHGYPKEYTYQWYMNGSKISGETSPNYTFTPSDAGNTTVYCIISNRAGSVTTRTATITAKAINSLIPGNGFSSIIDNNGSNVVRQNSDGSWYFSAGGTGYHVVDIDVTEFKSMTVKGSYESFKGRVSVGLFSNKYGALITGFQDEWADHGGSINNTYDISSVTGTVYVGVCGKQNHEEKQHLRVTLTDFVFKG